MENIGHFCKKAGSHWFSRTESVQLILQGRSGYCFHLNGAFSVLLHSLGYRVCLHRAGFSL
ncbi:arylamine N-acetyltransferase [Paenibacillus sp. NPDC055715]